VVALGAAGAGRAEATLRVVVACDLGRLSSAQVLAWCRERLAEHKVPRSVVLVEEIPRTSRGKVDREAVLGLVGSCKASGALRSQLR
jgi:acyl-CoA synthetase (AMP-forming)/AMP-acid ligase II